ncbi:MAG: DNA polymerase I [Patescibacteria group bacterium]
MSETKRFYILDGNALLHRAWHAIPPLTTKEGLVVNAVYGFAMVFEKLIANEKPTHLAVCWDMEGGTFRNDLFEKYKAHREKKEDELYAQIPIIERYLNILGVPLFKKKGFEADDLLGTLAKKSSKHAEITIVTGDLDSLQLVNDKVSVLFFVKGLSETKLYDINAVKERFGFGPETLVDYKALRGDASDNIPGVKGIGEKTATELLQKYGSLAGIYRMLKKGNVEKDFRASVAEKLSSGERDAMLCQKLAKIVLNVPIEFSLKDSIVKKPNEELLRAFYREMEFSSLLKKREGVSEIIPSSSKGRSVGVKPSGAVVIIQNDAEIKDALEMLKTADTIAIDARVATASLFGQGLAVFAISDGKQSFVFPNPTADVVRSVLSETSGKEVISHDLKRLLHLLDETNSLDWSFTKAKGVDLMVASYLTRAGSRNYDVDTVLSELFGTGLPNFPTSFSSVHDLKSYGELVAAFVKSSTEAKRRLEKDEMLKLYEEVEHPLISVLFGMELSGILVDEDSLGDMSKSLGGSIGVLEKKIWKEAGHEFNISSPSQLAEVLFNELKLPAKGLKKTQTGISTAANELEKIEDAHNVVKMIGEYRELTKLKSTYVDALPLLIKSDGRVHTTFNQTITATGRLSSSDPNLQNIPIRTEIGREIRKAFVAPEGKVLVAADYSQIELRLVAAFSKDKNMLEVFKSGGDIHAATAAKVFGVNENEVSPEQRRAAKTVNFGIIYGMGPRALARNIGVSFEDAKSFIEKYFLAFPGVRQYLDEALLEAKRKGYAETIFGRRRYLPDLKNGVQMLRAAAERMATNMPLQGAAADIMKKAMLKVADWKKPAGTLVLLQVHDELVLEVPRDVADDVVRVLPKLMCDVADLAVPLEVKIKTGKNWGEME